jgi:hypothetical protein
LKPALLFAPSEHKSPVAARQLRLAARASVVTPPWMNWLINLSIAAVLGAAGFAFYWLVVR